MSSILKILVDIQCLVYCDFEQVGEAFPNSIFKMELRKGMYIIDFKKDDISSADSNKMWFTNYASAKKISNGEIQNA